MEESQHTRNEEENAVHDPKRKGSLKHRTLLIATKIQAIHIDASYAKIDLVRIAGCDVCAVFMGNAAKFIDACDERADETEVDEGDEEGVAFGAGVGEEGADCPGGCEHGDDEEDEDVGGC
jgi:hypothetical protein